MGSKCGKNSLYGDESRILMNVFTINSTFKSFNISIICHGIFIIVVSYLFASPDIKELEYGKKIIMLSSISGPSNGAKAKVGSVKASSQVRSAKVETSVKASSESSINSVAASEAGSSGTDGHSAAGSGAGAGAGEGSGHDFNGSILNYSEPAYPRMALVRGIEGSLKVRIKVDPEGNAIESTILKSSGSDLLDSSGLNAIKKWKFIKRDIKTFYFVEKTIIFQIKK